MILAKIYNKKHIKTFLFSFLSCLLIYRIYTYALANQTIRITPASFFSAKTTDLLALYTTDIYTHRSLSELLTALKKELPFINKITRRWLPSKELVYSFFSQEPLAQLNSSLIMLQDSCIHASSFFNTEKQGALYYCDIDDEKLLLEEKNEDLGSFIKNKLPKLYETYSIVWYDKTCIALKKQKEYKETIYITADSVIDDSFFNKAAAVYLLLEKSYKKTADMRYKDYIVITA